MGSPSYRDHVEWARVDESNDIVVEKRDPGIVADLTCIAEISSVKYWMFPGGYCTAANKDGDQESNGFKPVPFHRSRGSARLVQPRKPQLDNWWIDTTKNLAALRREGTKKPMKTDIFDDNYSHMVRIRHDWFKPKDIMDTDENDSEEESEQILLNVVPSRMTTPTSTIDKGKGKDDMPADENVLKGKEKENTTTEDEYKDPFDDDQFHLSTWNFFSQSDWATSNITKILDQDELQAIPLPAFDLKRNRPIHPNDCETMLKGALVKITFNLARQTISQNNVNVYLDVVKITRLLPPGYEDKPTSMSTKRRPQGNPRGPMKKARLPRY